MKRVPYRRDVILLVVFLVVTILSGGAFSFVDLVSGILPSYTQRVPTSYSPLKTNSQYYGGFQLMTFQKELQSNTTLHGNVTLCCISNLPTLQNLPSLFVFTSSEYTALKDEPSFNPWSAHSEASIKNGAFGNYTVNEQTRTEGLLVQFTAKETGIYFFLVIVQSGESAGTLYLSYYRSEIVRPYELALRIGSGLSFVVFFILTAYFTYRSLTKREEKIQFHPRVLSCET